MHRKNILCYGLDMVKASLVTPDSKFVRDVLNQDWTAADEFIRVILHNGDPVSFIGTAELPKNFSRYARELLDIHKIYSTAALPSAPFLPPPMVPGTVPFPEEPETTPYPPPSWYTSIRNNLSSPMGLERITTVVQTMVGWAIILAVGWLLVAGLTYTAVAGWRLIDASFAGGTVAAGECGLNATVLEARFAALEDNITGLDNRVVFFQDISRVVVASMHEAGNATLDQIKVDAGVILAKQEDVLVEMKENAAAAFAAQEAALKSNNQVLDKKAKDANEKFNKHMTVLGEESARSYADITSTNAELVKGYKDMTERFGAAKDRLVPLEENVNQLSKTLPLIVAQANDAEEKAVSANLILEHVNNGWTSLYQWTTFYFACVVAVSVYFVYACNSEPRNVPFTVLESSHDVGNALRNLNNRVVFLEDEVKNLKTGPSKIGAFLWNFFFVEAPRRA